MPYYLHGIYFTEADLDGGSGLSVLPAVDLFFVSFFFQIYFHPAFGQKFIVFFHLGGNQCDIEYFLHNGYSGI